MKNHRSQAISRTDQTLPYYVMDVAGHLPGLPGLFLAGLVSAALATMSASLNTMSGTVYEDFVSPWIPDSARKEAKAANIMKVRRATYALLLCRFRSDSTQSARKMVEKSRNSPRGSRAIFFIFFRVSS